MIWLWHIWATAFSVLGTVVLWPVSVAEEWWDWDAQSKGKAEYFNDDDEKNNDRRKVGFSDGLAKESIVGVEGNMHGLKGSVEVLGAKMGGRIDGMGGSVGELGGRLDGFDKEIEGRKIEGESDGSTDGGMTLQELERKGVVSG